MTTPTQSDAPTVHRATQIGIVTSDKMQKTITVKVERLVRHPKYGKYIKRFSLLKAHDPLGSAKLGDKVEVEFTRPRSKTKRWRLLRVVDSAKRDQSSG
ncbi:MAG: 30S ribosomal protein S17 [Planctomycetota bacterium]